MGYGWSKRFLAFGEERKGEDRTLGLDGGWATYTSLGCRRVAFSHSLFPELFIGAAVQGQGHGYQGARRYYTMAHVETIIHLDDAQHVRLYGRLEMGKRDSLACFST